MAIDEVPKQENLALSSSEGSSRTGLYVAIFLVLAALATGEIYILSQLRSLETQQAQAQKQMVAQLQEEISKKVSALERTNAAQLEAFKADLNTTAKHVQWAGGTARNTRLLVTKLQNDQKQQAEILKQEIAQKADQQQLGALSQDVSATRTDLSDTKKVLDATRSDLGMVRSEFGTLIARNHDEIEQLRKLGERDYFEFTLQRDKLQKVSGVGLLLRKTNVKAHRFNMDLLADDMQIEKKNRTINEPIFFYVGGSKRFYELVVNKVESRQVKGYMSTPKGATETAQASEGGR